MRSMLGGLKSGLLSVEYWYGGRETVALIITLLMLLSQQALTNGFPSVVVFYQDALRRLIDMCCG